LSESWEELVADVHELIDVGERVVALVRFRGRSATTGMALDGVSVDGQVWTFRAGRVVSVEMYSGTEAALRAVGLSE
jgi:ketosteroid isomerase-like protein